ncbi:aminoglycoside N(3)-acetyltransferase [Salisediminibacterium selenitireducens]|uniref:Aminoglycoside N(3)-acetyltransferase n=1 Tax=Bacillus selenitireducens (strain ATCC 700615 / DSM 15326 / MLS10) TaxID=439292 RepID=D6XX80_BACIE|nr:AAC(3) family N-acetyltransferase [Salisediminibacterium selenitireducens]ADH97937.1 Aminoglycoside N(3')-acetyltransferase [[Bacillus] selenitireducens MLS10]
MTNEIHASTVLNTVDTLTRDLKINGIEEGDLLLVHASLSALGWVNGGSAAVIGALITAIGPDGTIVMPAQSGDLSDPSEWEAPAVPQAWWQTIRDTMPAYDPAITQTRGIGTIAEHFRTWPGTDRSLHPALSFSARGPLARTVLHPHPLACGLGEDSPLGRLYEHGAKVLFIGNGYDANTCFHLGEYIAPSPPMIEKGAPVLTDGVRQWITYEEVDLDEEVFEEIGRTFEETYPVHTGKIGDATAKVFALRDAVDASTTWFTAHRQTQTAD